MSIVPSLSYPSARPAASGKSCWQSFPKSGLRCQHQLYVTLLSVCSLYLLPVGWKEESTTCQVLVQTRRRITFHLVLATPGSNRSISSRVTSFCSLTPEDSSYSPLQRKNSTHISEVGWLSDRWLAGVCCTRRSSCWSSAAVVFSF